MRVYALTKLGKKVTRACDESSEEMKILQHLRENGQATDSELEMVGELWLVKVLKRRGLVKELTQ